MTPDQIIALVGFAFASSITPGPNNLMLLASGSNFGVRRSVPHMLGISIGHSVMIVMVGLGLGRAFEALPVAQTALTVVSVAYLLYLAWRIATAVPRSPQAAARARPFTFVQAAAFQWVNPKAWFMATSAITLYAAGTGPWSVALVAIVFACTNLPSITAWTVLGQQMRRVLTSPARLRAFNWTMAALLVGSLALLI
ncbi:MAG: LysE family translocator [Paracoccaceae bacterium]